MRTIAGPRRRRRGRAIFACVALRSFAWRCRFAARRFHAARCGIDGFVERERIGACRIVAIAFWFGGRRRFGDLSLFLPGVADHIVHAAAKIEAASQSRAAKQRD